MFGKLLSNTLKVVTLPIDASNCALDVLTGGDGSKASREDADLMGLEALRDELSDILEDIDE